MMFTGRLSPTPDFCVHQKNLLSAQENMLIYLFFLPDIIWLEEDLRRCVIMLQVPPSSCVHRSVSIHHLSSDPFTRMRSRAISSQLVVTPSTEIGITGGQVLSH